MKSVLIIFLLFKLLIAENSEILNYLNYLRNKAGMISLEYNPLLAKAAYNHSKFIAQNYLSPTHYESQNYPYFTGVTPSDRAIYVGYLSQFVLENFSVGSKSWQDSIDSLFGAIYHRFGFLDFSINEIGFGYDKNERYKYKTVYVYDMGNSLLNNLCSKYIDFESGYYYTNVCADNSKKIPKDDYLKTQTQIQKQNPKVVVYPPNNSNNIPPAFFSEIPDPLPDYDVSGYPISIEFNPFYFNENDINLLSFEIRDKNGNILDTVYIDSRNDINHKFPKMAYAIFPKKRLEWNSRYFVRAKFYINGEEKTFKWSFKTRSLPYKILRVTSYNQTFYVKPNKEYALYFVPLNKHDIFQNYSLQRYSNMKVVSKFIDFNTLYVKINGNAGDKAVITTNNRKVILKVSNGSYE